MCPMEVHLFQPQLFEGHLGSPKSNFFEHLDVPNLSATHLVLLDPTKYTATDVHLSS